MSEFIRDPIWQFIGATLGVIAIFVSIGIFWAQRRRKSLSYELLSRTSVLSMAEELEGKLQILFQGERVHKVHLLVVRLANTGNTPILASDYDRPVTFAFAASARLLTAEVSEMNPNNLGASVLMDNQRIIVQPVLLNSGDAITIKALVSQFDGAIDIDGRVVGVKRIDKREESFTRVVILMFGGLALSFLGSLLFSRANPQPPTPPPRIESWPFIILMVLGYVISLYGMFGTRRYRQIFTRVLKRRK